MGWWTDLTDSVGLTDHKGKDAASKKAAEAAALAAEERRKAEQAAADATKQQLEQQKAMQDMQREAFASQQRDRQTEMDAQAQAQAAAKAEADRLKNIGENAQVDLRADTTANVVAAGTANDAGADALIKKKKAVQTTGMAAQLGINV